MAIDSLNGTFTNIDNRGIDSFTITPDVSAYNFISGYNGVENTVGVEVLQHVQEIITLTIAYNDTFSCS